MYSFFAVYNIQQDQLSAEEMESQKIELLVKAVQSDIDKCCNPVLTGVLAVANDENVQKLFAARDREGLLALLNPLYNEISGQVSQFHFHLPDSISFLRVHLPSSYGDSLEGYRASVVKANSELRTVIGIEEGLGGLGYRVVTPVFFQGAHIGSVEMGVDLGSYFIYSLKETYGSDYYLYSVQSPRQFLAATRTKDLYPIEDELRDQVLAGEKVYALSPDQLDGMVLLPLKTFDNKVIAFLKIVSNRRALIADLQKKSNSMQLLFLVTLVVTAALIIYLLQINILKPLNSIKA